MRSARGEVSAVCFANALQMSRISWVAIFQSNTQQRIHGNSWGEEKRIKHPNLCPIGIKGRGRESECRRGPLGGDLRERRAETERLIAKEEEEKARIVHEVQILTDRLKKVDEGVRRPVPRSLRRGTAARDRYQI